MSGQNEFDLRNFTRQYTVSAMTSYAVGGAVMASLFCLVHYLITGQMHTSWFIRANLLTIGAALLNAWGEATINPKLYILPIKIVSNYMAEIAKGDLSHDISHYSFKIPVFLLKKQQLWLKET